MKKQKIRFKDCGIYYELYLNPKKPTIVMLHSFASSSLIFSEQILILKRYYQILVIDFPAHGKSESSKNVKLIDMPEIINMIFDLEKINSAHFIGIKEGAEVAQAFAQIFPKKLKSLVGISTISIFHDSYKAVNSFLTLTNLKLNIYKRFNFKKYKQWFIDNSSISKTGKKLFKESMKGFNRESLKVKKDYKRFYNLGKQTYDYPTYLVCGENDWDVIKDASFQYEQKIPLTTLEGYRDAKQIVFLDNKRLFNERIKVFFKEVSRPEE